MRKTRTLTEPNNFNFAKCLTVNRKSTLIFFREIPISKNLLFGFNKTQIFL